MKEVHRYFAYDDQAQALIVAEVLFDKNGRYIRTTSTVFARFDWLYDAWRESGDRVATLAATTPDCASSYALAMAYQWASYAHPRVLARAKKAARRTER